MWVCHKTANFPAGRVEAEKVYSGYISTLPFTFPPFLASEKYLGE